jgi:hypothetical protein
MGLNHFIGLEAMWGKIRVDPKFLTLRFFLFSKNHFSIKY